MLLNTYEPWKFAFSAETDFDNIKKDSYGIIGVPFDSTTSYHSGSRLGPIVVREASYGFENYNINFIYFISYHNGWSNIKKESYLFSFLFLVMA